jgi:hypothetical protein
LLFCSGPGAGLASAQGTSYQPISSSERGHWFLQSTVGPKSLAAGVVSAGWGTALNKPEEYGPHWEGFAKRYGMRLTGVATGNALEAGLGRFGMKILDTFRPLRLGLGLACAMRQPKSSSLVALTDIKRPRLHVIRGSSAGTSFRIRGASQREHCNRCSHALGFGVCRTIRF